MCCLHACHCTTCMPGVLSGKKGETNDLELPLDIAVSSAACCCESNPSWSFERAVSVLNP